MSSAVISIKNLPGSFVNENYPTTNYGTRTQYAVRNDTGLRCRTYYWLSLPFPRGVKIISARLKLHSVAAMGGTRTMRVSRITTDWNKSKVTWNTRASATAAEAPSLTKSAIVANTLWDFDVSGMMQAVSDGAVFYGFQLDETTSDPLSRYFYGMGGTAAYVPVLEIQWSQTPDTPDGLTPSEGQVVGLARPTFTWNFHDVVGNTQMAAYEIQTSADSLFGSPTSLGQIASDIPQHTWTTDISAAFYWRVRNKDGDGIWSDWSKPAYCGGFIAKGTLTIDSPAGATLEDISPVIVWTPSLTQMHFQVMVFSVRASTEKLIYDSGKLTSPLTSDTVSLLEPASSLVVPLDHYRLEVRSWDTYPRATTPGDTAYVSETKTFNRVDDGTIDPVASITKSPDQYGRPWMPFKIVTPNAPDSFRLRRDGVLIDQVFDPGVVHLTGTTYLVVDRKADPRKEHVWEVLREENGKLSADNPIFTGKFEPSAAWLCSSDGRYSFPFLNYDASGLALGENSAQFFPLNSEEGWTVFQGQRGFSGSFVGVLSGELGAEDADEYIRLFMQMRGETGLEMQLSYANLNLTGTVSQATFSPTVFTEEVVNGVSFTFTQKGELV